MCRHLFRAILVSLVIASQSHAQPDPYTNSEHGAE